MNAPGAAPPAVSGLPRRFTTFIERRERRPVYAVWELTRACDQRCSHCGTRAGRRLAQELTTSQAQALPGALARLGTREITLIGGEAYLRSDWLDVVRAIRDSGLDCTMQSGGLHLSEARVRAARRAGLQGVGVSVAGLEALHDRIRGVRGSFRAALLALRRIRDTGLAASVNTDLCPAAVAQLPELLEHLIAAGAQAWRVSLIVPAGAAADQPDLWLQPHELLDLVPLLARLATEARPRDLDVQVDDGVGYFGPHEELLRGWGHEEIHWSGCASGTVTIGIESDGTVKGCLSLPTDPYGAGRVTDRSIDDIWRESEILPASRALRLDDLRGFCQSCYYAQICLAGCTWMAHALFGRPGDNPYCHHRTIELQRQGLRERVVRVAAARRQAFACGLFERIVEHVEGAVAPPEAGEAMDGTRLRDQDKLCEQPWSGEALVLWRGCQRHVFPRTRQCPHCGGDVRALRRHYQDAAERVREAHARLREAIRMLSGQSQDESRPANELAHGLVTSFGR